MKTLLLLLLSTVSAIPALAHDETTCQSNYNERPLELIFLTDMGLTNLGHHVLVKANGELSLEFPALITKVRKSRPGVTDIELTTLNPQGLIDENSAVANLFLRAPESDGRLLFTKPLHSDGGFRPKNEYLLHGCVLVH